ADGQYLHAADMHVFTGSTGTTMTGTDADELYYGGTGNDTIIGGNGIGLLFGGQGNDSILGGPANDYLFGGDGNDRLDGGWGTNYFKGGAGADTFVFDNSLSLHDVIADFNTTADHLEIKQNLGGNGLLTAADVLSHATSDAHGNAVLHLGASSDVTLVGV